MKVKTLINKLKKCSDLDVKVYYYDEALMEFVERDILFVDGENDCNILLGLDKDDFNDSEDEEMHF